MDRVPTLDHGDMFGEEPIHQGGAIRITKRRVFSRGEQLHRYRARSYERLKIPPFRPQQLTNPGDIEQQPVPHRVLGVSACPDWVLFHQRHDGPGRILPRDPYGILHAIGDGAKIKRPGQARGIFDHHPVAVLRRKTCQSQSNDRTERMAGQDIDGARHLSEHIASKVIHSQSVRANIVSGSVTQHVDGMHLPPEIAQILLEPPPSQLAGLHPVQKQDRPLVAHLGHSTRRPATPGQPPRPPADRGEVMRTEPTLLSQAEGWPPPSVWTW